MQPTRTVDPSQFDAWIDSFDGVVREQGRAAGHDLLKALVEHARARGLTVPANLNTPYVNTIPVDEQPPYPGDREIERRIKNLMRWNAMAMVVHANKHSAGIGGHISTYASLATLFEVGFHHFFRAPHDGTPGDQVYFQGHASPGIYARAFLEGRLSEQQLQNFRRELAPGGGLSSYPHPWLMPDFWQFPTVSMGLSPICVDLPGALQPLPAAPADTSRHDGGRVWAFLGDGEMDEPEIARRHHAGLARATRQPRSGSSTATCSASTARCAATARSSRSSKPPSAAPAGTCIKVIWGDDWDPLLARDDDGLLVQRMNEVIDGQYQKYTVESGAYIREHFFGTHPELLALVEDFTDAKLRKLRRGGHDPEKVFAAYKAAVEHHGSPTVILAKTIKGYGLGEAGEGRNVTHQQKKLNEKELREFRDRLGIPIREARPRRDALLPAADDSEEIEYLLRAPARARRLRAAAARAAPRRSRRRRRRSSASSSAARTTARSRRRWSWSACCAT